MSGGFSFGGNSGSGGFSFSQTTAQAPATGFSFGTPASTTTAAVAAPAPVAATAPSFSFSSAAPQQQAGFSFASLCTPAAAAAAAAATSTAAAPTATGIALGQSTGFGNSNLGQGLGTSLTGTTATQPLQLRVTSAGNTFLTAPAATTTATLAAPSTGFFAPRPTLTAAPLTLGANTLTAPKTTALAGFGAPATPATGIFAKPSTTTSASTLGGLLQAPAVGTNVSTLPQLGRPAAQVAPIAASLSTNTSTTASTVAPPSMNYRQLEEEINKWSVELQDQEKIFIEQATQVNAWDRMLIDNGEKISELNADVDRVKLDQQRLDGELDFINAQQRELEEMLMPLEQAVEQMPPITFQQHADLEREHTYKLSENVDAQLKRMVQDLKEIIDHMNTSNTNTDATDPAQQIAKILNAHMHSLQWIDSNTALLQRRVDDVTRLAEHRKKEQERNFRLAYD